MNIAGVEIGQGHPCRTVAELSNNHNGSLDTAKRIITTAKEAGADFVKFQCYTPAELVALRGDGPAPEPWGEQGWTMERLYEKAQTPHGWFPDLVAHANDIGMPWFSSVFGPLSLALLESLDCPAYKIAALDQVQWRWRRKVRNTRKPVIRSVRGMFEEVGLDTLLNMLCPKGYPQESARLGHIQRGCGYSYHGTDPDVPAAAALCGAKLIECHMQLDAEPSELEANVSLTETQFADMVQRIRYYEGLL